MSEDRSSNGHKSWLDKITQAFAHEPRNRQELLELLRDAHDNKLLDSEALSIVEGAIQVADLQVRDIMVPRSQMMSIRSTQTPKEFLPAIIEAAHSRYPVVGESLDDVMGVLLAKDLLPLILHNDERPFDIKELLRPATFVPESKRLNVLLREFRANRNHMAIVIDEYGGVAGLVTIEDVLEQIVGDIEDEHDVEEDSYIKPLPSGDFIVKALTPVDAFNDFFGSEFSDEEFDTVGGLVMSAFGHLPKRNEVVELGEFRFRVSTPTAAASICCACLPCRTERAPSAAAEGASSRAVLLASRQPLLYSCALRQTPLSPRTLPSGSRRRPRSAQSDIEQALRTFDALDFSSRLARTPAGTRRRRAHTPGPGALRLLAAGDPLDRPALSRLARPSRQVRPVARLVVRFRRVRRRHQLDLRQYP